LQLRRLQQRHFGGKTSMRSIRRLTRGGCGVARPAGKHRIRSGSGSRAVWVKEIADVRASRAGYFDAFVLPHDAAGGQRVSSSCISPNPKPICGRGWAMPR